MGNSQKIKSYTESDFYSGAKVKLLRGSQEGAVGIIKAVHGPIEDDPDGQLDVNVGGKFVYVGFSDVDLIV